MNSEERIARIEKWLEEGYTYADIGRMLGVSRQRIWQIAKDNDIATLNVFRATEAARKWNCSETTIYHLIKNGIIKAERKRSRWNILTLENPRLCVICGKPVPKGKVKYCSVKCYNLAMIKKRKQGMWRRFRESTKRKSRRK
jgi:predicted nucleic acid-binding Zn ribbon protein/DNA-binding CsgD family transcriptional regulator